MSWDSLNKWWPIVIAVIGLVVHIIQADHRLAILEENFATHVRHQDNTLERDVAATKILLLRLCYKSSASNEECRLP